MTQVEQWRSWVITIIPCGYKKRDQCAPAYAMYTGAYFRANLRYALSILERDRIFILSAKYGLLALEDEICPYNIKMGDPGSVSADLVRTQAANRKLLNETAICLGGNLYTSVMRQVWHHCITPLENLGGMGFHMQWLRQHRGMIPNEHHCNR